MKIVYMGTPDFAVMPLERLLSDGHEILGVFTRPDKPKGRGMKLTPTPVKVFAQSRSIPVFQTPGFKSGEALKILQELQPDVIVVVAYGRILPKEVLDLPPYGCINVHASLLPYLRGAAPIQWSIVRGLRETGVTTMHMSPGLDEGDMIYQEKTEITPEDDAGTLHDRLAQLGSSCLSKTLDDLKAGIAPRIPQDHTRATFAPPIRKEDTRIDWTQTAENVRNLIRGMSPWPGAWTTLDGGTFRVLSGELGPDVEARQPGEILTADSKQGLLAACGGGTTFRLKVIQAPGGKRMEAEAYLRGHSINKGARFGESPD